MLQSISGVEFPTGTDCVTRCPIILQLWCDEKASVEVWIEGDAEDKTLISEDFSQTKVLIEKATQDLLSR